MATKAKLGDSPITADTSKKKVKKKKRKILILVGIVLLSALLGVGIYLYLTDGLPAPIQEALAKDEPPEITYVVGDFIVNLSGNRGRDYLKASLALGYTLEGGQEILTAKNDQIRDTIISSLMSKSREEILDIQAREAIKKEITEEVNKWFKEDLEGDLIEDVYFTEYLVQ